MPELDWDPQDFQDFLGVAPYVAAEDPYHIYSLTRSDLTLELFLWPQEGVISVGLRSLGQEKELLSFNAVVRGPVHRVSYPDEEYMLFPNCVLVDNWWYIYGIRDKVKYPKGIELALFVNPSVRFKLG